ncbi:Riibonuclease P, partial [mine drainage metagenome]
WDPRTQAEAPQGPLAVDACTGAVNSRYRLRHSAEFQRVRSARRGVVDPLLRLQVRPNEFGHPRLGISVSRRLGGAVQRNLIRRRLRAAAAGEVSSLGAFDLVLIPSPAAASSSFQELSATVTRAFQRAGVRVG